MKKIKEFLNRKVMIGDTFFKLHSVILTVFCVSIFCVLAHAQTNFNVKSFIPGTTGVNWQVPYGVSDITVQSAATGNWVDITFFNTNNNQTINWANFTSVYPGTSWHRDGIWATGDNLGVRCHDAQCIAQITYITKDKNN